MCFLLLVVFGRLVAGCPEECFCRTTRQGVRVDCSNRNLTGIPDALPLDTVYLDLQGNELSNFSLFELENFTSLIELDLSSNDLEFFEEDFTVALLSSLEVLVLKFNRFAGIPPSVAGMPSLKRLELRGNEIMNLTFEEWEVLSRILDVDLTRNHISELPVDAVFEDPKIQKLDLSANNLEEIAPRAFSSMHSLNTLRLARNKLKEIDKETFYGLSKLRELDLSRNPISSVPSLTFSVLPSLNTVSFARCHISRMEDGAFFGSEHLKLLNLSSNRLSVLNDGWLFGLQSLHTIDLSHNLLTAVEPSAWAQVASLKKLLLTGNKFASLPSGAFRTLRQLEHLSLASNQLDSLHKTAMAGLDTLLYLDISSNSLAVCVEDGAVLQGTLPNLRHLNFANNQLRQLPARAFARFSSLEVLDISDNTVTTIHHEAFEPLKLKRLLLNTSWMLCDCNMAWFAGWLAGSGLSRDEIIVRCAHPENLESLELVAIDSTNLTCVDESPRARVVHHPAKLQKALIGAEVLFECRAKGSPPLEIMWKVVENGKARTLEEEEESTLITHNTTISQDSPTEETVHSILELRDVTLDDRAEYQCIAKNKFGSDYSERGTLEVQQAPRFTHEPDDVSLLVGQNAKMTCAATGFPRPTMKWQKDGGDTVLAAIERRLHVRPGEDDLYLMEAKKEDGGVYTCIAVNDAGSAHVSATIRVYENAYVSITPRIDVRETETAVIDCTCGIQAGQRIEWTRDGRRVEVEADGGRLSLRANGQLMLIINTTIEDAGEYSCALFAGDDELTRQTITMSVHGEEHAMLVTRGRRSLTWSESATVAVLVAILAMFVIIGAVFSLVYFRRLYSIPYRPRPDGSAESRSFKEETTPANNENPVAKNEEFSAEYGSNIQEPLVEESTEMPVTSLEAVSEATPVPS